MILAGTGTGSRGSWRAMPPCHFTCLMRFCRSRRGLQGSVRWAGRAHHFFFFSFFAATWDFPLLLASLAFCCCAAASPWIFCLLRLLAGPFSLHDCAVSCDGAVGPLLPFVPRLPSPSSPPLPAAAWTCRGAQTRRLSAWLRLRDARGVDGWLHHQSHAGRCCAHRVRLDACRGHCHTAGVSFVLRLRERRARDGRSPTDRLAGKLTEA